MVSAARFIARAYVCPVPAPLVASSSAYCRQRSGFIPTVGNGEGSSVGVRSRVRSSFFIVSEPGMRGPFRSCPADRCSSEDRPAVPGSPSLFVSEAWSRVRHNHDEGDSRTGGTARHSVPHDLVRGRRWGSSQDPSPNTDGDRVWLTEFRPLLSSHDDVVARLTLEVDTPVFLRSV